MDALNSSGRVFVSHTTIAAFHGPQLLIRMAIGATTTQEHHIREAWSWIQEEATRILAHR
jgi:tyrosine decarboxylase